MEELRHTLPVRRSASRTRTGRAGSRPPTARRSRLAELLLEARQNKGLELRDLSVITNIRMSQLEALEAGDYQRLSKDASGKATIRLYAKSVGLDPARMLLIYAQERRGVYTATPAVLELPQDDSSTWRPFWGRLGRGLATLTLVAATLGGSLWAFNALLFPPVGVLPSQSAEILDTLPLDLSTAEVPVRPPPTPSAQNTPRSEASVGAGAETIVEEPQPAALPTDVPPRPLPVTPPPTTSRNPAASTTALSTAVSATAASTLTVPTTMPTTIMPAAPPATPIPTAPPTGRTEPVRDAPQPAPPAAADEPDAPTGTEAAAEAEVTPVEAASAPSEPAAQVAPAASDVTVSVSEAAWLEVYTGGARGEGERLLYRIAEAGERFSFAQPVYVYTGNAGGVSVALNGGPAEMLGIRGAVIGRGFSE